MTGNGKCHLRVDRPLGRWPNRRLPTAAVNDKGRYRQFHAQPRGWGSKAVSLPTEVAHRSTPASRTHRCTYGRSPAENDRETRRSNNSAAASLKQTSFIIHYGGWQKARGFLMRRGFIARNRLRAFPVVSVILRAADCPDRADASFHTSGSATNRTGGNAGTT
jgi:hypothetical protein